MNINEEAIKAVNVIVSALEQELPEWEVSLKSHDGPGFAIVCAQVIVKKNIFYFEEPYDYRDLIRMHPAMLPSRGIDLAMKCRNELRKAKKDASKFGV